MRANKSPNGVVPYPHRKIEKRTHPQNPNPYRKTERESVTVRFENVVGGKLKLKGKALAVKAGGVKKKKKNKKRQDQISEVTENELPPGGSAELSTDPNEEGVDDAKKMSGDGKTVHCDDHLTLAERRYIEQRKQIDFHRLAKVANKSHRDKIQDFNQYLANMSEHYDIPKVGPG
ncbi:uncharacterized protein LOC142635897 [Castanea sativa]|uniref:uncharacterized protein LOC142635897 n=1 Tax=Castanea sativa TaxID=21020 RepID=UPI003F653099